jgi:hypothetical protein
VGQKRIFAMEKDGGGAIVNVEAGKIIFARKKQPAMLFQSWI